MKYEKRAYYTRGFGYVAKLDKECSVPAKEIPDEEARQFMALIEANGGRKHETASQIFYDLVADSNHSTEYIFYK